MDTGPQDPVTDYINTYLNDPANADIVGGDGDAMYYWGHVIALQVRLDKAQQTQKTRKAAYDSRKERTRQEWESWRKVYCTLRYEGLTPREAQDEVLERWQKENPGRPKLTHHYLRTRGLKG